MFKANSAADNFAYNLQALNCFHMSDYYHHHFAHVWPVIADDITDVMNKLGARAERRGFDGDTKIYDNIAEIFADSLGMTEAMRYKVLDAIDKLDYDINNKEVILKLEDIANKVLDLMYMGAIWVDYVDYYVKKGKIMEADLKFDDFAEIGED